MSGRKTIKYNQQTLLNSYNQITNLFKRCNSGKKKLNKSCNTAVNLALELKRMRKRSGRQPESEIDKKKVIKAGLLQQQINRLVATPKFQNYLKIRLPSKNSLLEKRQNPPTPAGSPIKPPDQKRQRQANTRGVQARGGGKGKGKGKVNPGAQASGGAQARRGAQPRGGVAGPPIKRARKLKLDLRQDEGGSGKQPVTSFCDFKAVRQSDSRNPIREQRDKNLKMFCSSLITLRDVYAHQGLKNRINQVLSANNNIGKRVNMFNKINIIKNSADSDFNQTVYFNKTDLIDFFFLMWLDGIHDGWVEGNKLNNTTVVHSFYDFINKNEAVKIFTKRVPIGWDVEQKTLFMQGLIDSFGKEYVKKRFEAQLYEFEPSEVEETITASGSTIHSYRGINVVGSVFDSSWEGKIRDNFFKDRMVMGGDPNFTIKSGQHLVNIQKNTNNTTCSLSIDADSTTSPLQRLVYYGNKSLMSTLTPGTCVDPGNDMISVGTPRFISGFINGTENENNCAMAPMILNIKVASTPPIEFTISLTSATNDQFNLMVNGTKIPNGVTGKQAKQGDAIQNLGKFFGDGLQYIFCAFYSGSGMRSRITANTQSRSIFAFGSFDSLANLNAAWWSNILMRPRNKQSWRTYLPIFTNTSKSERSQGSTEVLVYDYANQLQINGFVKRTNIQSKGISFNTLIKQENTPVKNTTNEEYVKRLNRLKNDRKSNYKETIKRLTEKINKYSYDIKEYLTSTNNINLVNLPYINSSEETMEKIEFLDRQIDIAVSAMNKLVNLKNLMRLGGEELPSFYNNAPTFEINKYILSHPYNNVRNRMLSLSPYNRGLILRALQKKGKGKHFYQGFINGIITDLRTLSQNAFKRKYKI